MAGKKYTATIAMQQSITTRSYQNAKIKTKTDYTAEGGIRTTSTALDTTPSAKSFTQNEITTLGLTREDDKALE